ncbi:SRPBCC family protein [Streptomyces sp. NPDC057137]|uniref:SRPBCC family protein n=1 Tax=Streptomyces sp. NPDC057137 TaxID=3346030 RepID=UPI0036350C20
MEHEVFIPVPAETLREALRDHARVARCVPGLQQDADASARPLSGRLKVRVGGHTITYRGALTLTERAGGFTAKGEGAEVRGTGSAKVSVRVRLTETGEGTTVAFTSTWTPTSDGRLSGIAASTSEATARRLLDRFVAALAQPGAAPGGAEAEGTAESPGAAGVAGEGVGRDGTGVADAGVGRDGDVPASDAASAGGAHAADAAAPADRPAGSPAGGPGRTGPTSDGASAAEPRGGDRAPGDGSDSGGSDRGSDQEVTAAGATPTSTPGADRLPEDAPDVDAEAAESSDAAPAGDEASAGASSDPDPDPDPAPDTTPEVPDPDDPELTEPAGFDVPVPPSALDASAGFGVTASGDGDFLVPLDPPAEAAHARRTMIGRSAEEVDHAPPRGRYAPEQAPDAGGAGAALRWVAPAAALAIAGAVVVGRALRRRR